MSSARGTAKVLGDELAAERESVAGAVDQGEQLELIEREVADRAAGLDDDDAEAMANLPDAREIEALQAELDCDVYQAVREHRRRQGKGGRKVGSLNRRTREFREYLLRLGPHPGAVLARIYSRPVELLAAELGCDKAAAAQLQVRCAVEALPYVEGKMPVNVNVAVRGDFSLIAGAGTGLFDGIEDGEFDELPELALSQGNQDDSDTERGASE